MISRYGITQVKGFNACMRDAGASLLLLAMQVRQESCHSTGACGGVAFNMQASALHCVQKQVRRKNLGCCDNCSAAADALSSTDMHS